MFIIKSFIKFIIVILFFIVINVFVLCCAVSSAGTPPLPPRLRLREDKPAAGAHGDTLGQLLRCVGTRLTIVCVCVCV